MNRRKFMGSAALLAVANTIPLHAVNTFGPKTEKRMFRMCLNPGSIGVKANQKELLQMAIQHGYEAIVSMPEQLMAFSDMELSDFVGEMKANDISWGSTNIPVNFREDRHVFRATLAELPKYAKTLEKVGATRMNTWINNGHNDLSYLENFKRHTERLRACAKVLGHYGIRFGLEYVSPKTSVMRRRFPFIRTMREARELIAAIGEPNMGLVLDSFHWHCAEDTAEDILALAPPDIVTCDINDARSDLSRDEQIDGTRELPLATGVIDLKAFLNALVEIGYDGPVRTEPFNKKLNEMDNAAALKANTQAISKATALVGG